MPLDRHIFYEYDDYFRKTKETRQDGNWLAYEYDDRGNVTKKTVRPKGGDGTNDIITQSYYGTGCSNPKTCNQPVWTRDARGNQTDYTYDGATGLLTSVNKPAVKDGVRPYVQYDYTTVTSPYGAGGSISLLRRTMTCQTGAWGCGGPTMVGTYQSYFGADGNFLPSSLATGAHDGSLYNSVSYGYDYAGNQNVVIDPNGDIRRTGYDAARRVIWTVDPDPDGDGPQRGRATSIKYKADGTVDYEDLGTSAIDGGGFYAYYRTSYEYDGEGRRTAQSQWDNSGNRYAFSQYSYDSLGRPDCVTVRMNPGAFGQQPQACDLGTEGADGPDRIKRTEYDAAGRIIRTWAGYRTANAYHTDQDWTTNDKLHHIYDPKGNPTTYEYDGFDRLRYTCYNAAVCNGGDYEESFYDPDSNVTSKRLRDGNITTNEYDALSRLTRMTPAAAKWADRAVGYEYDNLDRMTLAADLKYGHDVIYTYDAIGRLVGEVNSHNDANHGSCINPYCLYVGYGYDAAGHRTWVGYGDGYSAGYGYDHAGHLTVVTEQRDPQQAYQLLAHYRYDEIGRRWALERINGAHSYYSFGGPSPAMTSMNTRFTSTGADYLPSFSYNSAGQITRRDVGNGAYSWSQGYQVNRGYQLNGLNQYTAAGMSDIHYDQRGNLMDAMAPNVGGNGDTSLRVRYQYTQANQLIRRDEQTAAGASTGNGSDYYYDALGRLGIDYQADRQLFYGGSQMLVAKAGGGVIVERYVYGADEAPLVRYDGQGYGTRRWLYTDEHGSVNAIADDAGAATAINRYDEYGIPANGNDGRFQYTGQQWLPTLGQYYYKARMYSPTLGRFLQTDPIGYKDGINWYNYVADDPVNKTDPNGESITELGFLIYDGAQAISDVAHGAGAGVLLNDAANIGLDVAPIPGLREIKGAVEVGRAVEHGVEAVRAERAAAREVGSYRHTFESGRTYDGKGTRVRAEQSAREVSTRNNDPHVSTKFTPASNPREAFKQESRGIQERGGPKSDQNYNRIDSPGTKMRKKDGEP